MGKAIAISENDLRLIESHPRYYVSKDRKVYSKCNSGYREVKQKYLPNGVSLTVELYTSLKKKTKLSVETLYYTAYPEAMRVALNRLNVTEHIRFKGYYVTRCGKVYTTFGNRIKLMKQTVMNNGYYAVNINQRPESVHRLVIETYIINYHNKKTVNHKDGNKLNNNINNLEWSTYQENNVHAIETGLRKRK